jgi:hypothetical protein
MVRNVDRRPWVARLIHSHFAAGSMEYPEEDGVGRVVDQGLELLKETRRDHRAPKAVANRVRIGLGLRHVGKGMQYDVPPEGLAVTAVESI